MERRGFKWEREESDGERADERGNKTDGGLLGSFNRLEGEMLKNDDADGNVIVLCL